MLAIGTTRSWTYGLRPAEDGEVTEHKTAEGGPAPAVRAGVAPGSWAGRPAVLAAVLILLAVQSTAVASLGTPLLPTIQAVDHVSLAASQWALTIALLTGAVATPVLGRLGDGRLRRQAVLGTVATMLAGCVLCAIPAGFAVFLTGRALQGVVVAGRHVPHG